jgi:Arc/MetJ-type ribon-helix-helix transcriptional regulator
VKLSVSLSEADVAALDEYVRSAGLSSRSAAVQLAVRRLRRGDLESAYAEAFAEWDASGERDQWESAAGDGLGDAAR